VASDVQHKVVILYEHPLLGEGIAKYLRAQIGIEATLGAARDPEAVKSALAQNPGVVIFESNDPFQPFDLSALVPNAVLIDVSTVVTRGSDLSPGVAGLEHLVQAIRESAGTNTAPSQSAQVETSASSVR
jgi:DNA-binding NarL/FixJ family response regulator